MVFLILAITYFSWEIVLKLEMGLLGEEIRRGKTKLALPSMRKCGRTVLDSNEIRV